MAEEEKCQASVNYEQERPREEGSMHSKVCTGEVVDGNESWLAVELFEARGILTHERSPARRLRLLALVLDPQQKHAFLILARLGRFGCG